MDSMQLIFICFVCEGAMHEGFVFDQIILQKEFPSISFKPAHIAQLTFQQFTFQTTSMWPCVLQSSNSMMLAQQQQAVQFPSAVHRSGIHTTTQPQQFPHNRKQQRSRAQHAPVLRAVDPNQQQTVPAPWSLTFDLRERETEWTEENKVTRGVVLAAATTDTSSSCQPPCCMLRRPG